MTRIFLLYFFPLFLCLHAAAQSDYIPLGDKQYSLINRLDIKLQHDSIFSHSAVKPYNRKQITQRVLLLDFLIKAGQLSAVDKHNIHSLLMSNAEWTPYPIDSFRSRKPILGKFFQTPSHLYESYSKDFVFIVDPVLNLQTGRSSDLDRALYINTRGITARGRIGNVGFYTYLTDNQERDAQFVQDYVNQHHAVPGAGFYKQFGKDGYDYFDARGGIDFSMGKYVNFRFGYDRLFLGDGYRSLFLSNFSTNYLYLQMDVQLRKFSYKSVYAELVAPFDPSVNRDTLRYKNYMVFHRLGLQVSKWLNIGLYENVLYNGSHGIELSYLNPAIFYRSIESELGSGKSKATVGLDFKSNITSSIQMYGQLFVGEFVIDEILHYGRHSWLNKNAVQLGAKYIDVANIKNLDVQAEVNIIRPYVYQHRDSLNAFAHYNSPLAHPAGANFKELVLIANYQPFAHLRLTGKAIGRRQGLDSAGVNMGGDIFRNYMSRPRDYGFYTGVGIPATTWLFTFNGAYEVRENLFVEGSVSRRDYSLGQSSSYFTVGLRWNIAPRVFEF
jgi:hypothetical protein